MSRARMLLVSGQFSVYERFLRIVKSTRKPNYLFRRCPALSRKNIDGCCLLIVAESHFELHCSAVPCKIMNQAMSNLIVGRTKKLAQLLSILSIRLLYFGSCS